MVTGSKPRPPNLQCAAWNLHLGQPGNLPFFPDPFSFTPVSEGVSALLHGSSPNQESSVLQCQREEAQCPISGRGNVAPIGSASQKKILIFDQSGDHTRLFISPSFYQNDQKGQKMFQDCYYNNSLKPIADEQENMNMNMHMNVNVSLHSSCKESEEEDSEDINALLYSDSEEEEEEDDDVTSTGHSPFIDDPKQHIEISDDLHSSKRQKLHHDDDDGGDKNSFTAVKSANSPFTHSKKDQEGSDYAMGTPDGNKNSPVKSVEGVSTRPPPPAKGTVEESHEGGGDDEEDDDRKGKILKTLRVLRGLIVGMNSDDPVVVIDEAISYLKVLRMKVKEMAKAQSFDLLTEREMIKGVIGGVFNGGG